MTNNVETQTQEQLEQIPATKNSSEANHEEVQNQTAPIENNINSNPTNNEAKSNPNSKQSVKNDNKRPPNAYVLFCTDNRKKVLEQNPTFTAMEVSKTLSKMWKELDSIQVNIYKDRAKELFDKYKQDNPEFHYKMNNKSSKKTTVRINQKDAFQIFNHLFQTSPFILQQMLLEKDKKGHLDIAKMLSLQ